MFTGQDMIDVGSPKVGQKYIFGARAPLDNPNWKGPWDCAEFVSWCAYQAYGQIFGAGEASTPAKADPYSGYWYAEAKKYGRVIAWAEALKIPGAILIRAPAQGRIGHVAIAMGDGDRTLEARGANFGVGIFAKAKERAWSIGCLLPGVEYDATIDTAPAQPPPPAALPEGYLWLKRPNFKGAAIVALQKALSAAGIDPGPIDGEYGPMTDAAVVSLQLAHGLEIDGVVGPNTAAALGLPFPIRGTNADTKVFDTAKGPKGPSDVVLPSAAAIDGVVGITRSDKTYTAATTSGETFIVGTSTPFTDDMSRTGLFQGSKAIKDSMKFGVYAAVDFTGDFGQWAHFIEPTMNAEGGARFATLNTYDRAAFTFGAPQLAAHTPGQNFIVYLRRLLTLPNADLHFPELTLRANAAGETTVHLKDGAKFVDLEVPKQIVRPNGKKDTQLVALMAYLNPSPTAIDEAELSAAARLMNWLRLDPAAKRMQIEVFVETARKNLDRAKTKVKGFDGSNWRHALWIMDILHQGRGSFAEMSTALASADPEDKLRRIGLPRYKNRIDTVTKGISDLAKSGVLKGFTV